MKLVGTDDAVPYVVLTAASVPLTLTVGVVAAAVAFSWILSKRLFPAVAVAPVTVRRRYPVEALSRLVIVVRVVAAKEVAVIVLVSAAVQLDPSGLVSQRCVVNPVPDLCVA